jgi:hypothetical protein
VSWQIKCITIQNVWLIINKSTNNLYRIVSPRTSRKHLTHVLCVSKRHKIFIANGEGTRPRGRSRSRWEDNIIMDLFKETGWENVDRMHLAHNRDQSRALVNTFGSH